MVKTRSTYADLVELKPWSVPSLLLETVKKLLRLLESSSVNIESVLSSFEVRISGDLLDFLGG